MGKQRFSWLHCLCPWGLLCEQDIQAAGECSRGALLTSWITRIKEDIRSVLEMVNPKDPPSVMYFLKLRPTSQINTTSWGPSFKAGACWFTPESSHNSHLQTKIAKGTTVPSPQKPSTIYRRLCNNFLQFPNFLISFKYTSSPNFYGLF